MAVSTSLHDESARQLFDVVDQLRSLPNIRDEIELPQFVVIGQPSAGKSSVLKAISNINFPNDSGFRTQFATEIVCRREASVTTKVSILPSAPISDEYSAKLSAFSERWKNSQPDQDVSRIIRSAAETMGLLSSPNKTSRDRLRLEFSGPRLNHISITDLPSLLEQDTTNQRLDEKNGVEQIIQEHVLGNYTIILAVVSGVCDMQIQNIVDVCTPHKHRTLGIVTAPHMVESGSTGAATFKQLVANKSFPTGLGWHVLRTLSRREEQDGKCYNAVESMFFANPSTESEHLWEDIPKIHLGIDNLKCKLETLLQELLMDQVPLIRRQIHDSQRDCESKLKLMGTERTTLEQRREHVICRSETLRDAIAKELRGGINGSSLRSRIRTANDQFANNMLHFGSYWKFMPDSDENISPEPSSETGSVWPAPLLIKKSQWLQEMHVEFLDCRGHELASTVDSSWIGKMFVKQSSKWRDIAYAHAEETFAIVCQCLDQVIQQVVGPDHAEQFHAHAIASELETRYEALKIKVAELLSPYVTENIRTLNRNFHLRQDNYFSTATSGKDVRSVTHEMIARYMRTMTEYYEIAINVFTDNMESLAIENVLLSGLEDIMTASKAYRMDETQLIALTTESEEVRQKRERLRSKMLDYERATRIMLRFSMLHGCGAQRDENSAPQHLGLASPVISISQGLKASALRATDHSVRTLDEKVSSGASKQNAQSASIKSEAASESAQGASPVPEPFRRDLPTPGRNANSPDQKVSNQALPTTSPVSSQTTPSEQSSNLQTRPVGSGFIFSNLSSLGQVSFVKSGSSDQGLTSPPSTPGQKGGLNQTVSPFTMKASKN